MESMLLRRDGDSPPTELRTHPGVKQSLTTHRVPLTLSLSCIINTLETGKLTFQRFGQNKPQP